MKHMLMRSAMLSHTKVFDSASQASVVTIAINWQINNAI